MTTITGTTNTGQPATVTITYPPAAMLVGITCDPKDYGTRLARWPAARMTRIFGGPGKGIPPRTVLDDRQRPHDDQRINEVQQLCPGVIPHVSFKDWGDDDTARKMLRAWLPPANMAPRRDGLPHYLISHMHEPGPKDADPREYRRRQFVLANMLAEFGQGGIVELVHIDANIWVEDKGGRDLSIYLPGVGAPAVDTYARSWKPYPTVAELLWAPLTLAEVTGTAPFLPEFGIAKRPDDPTGGRRAELMVACVARLRAEGCRGVSWWDDLGTAPKNGGPAPDFRLDDEPSRRAWADAMAGRI
ncbi:hypothetical protein [Catenuloplanes japonicus]|uniref:hypothetical protein n=1 Tax=Catenuloplanes japonicus TaxID=33876 RepID=UPI0005249DB0|nr:hypothetical protein [Catenuloplanes japonicus]